MFRSKSENDIEDFGVLCLITCSIHLALVSVLFIPSHGKEKLTAKSRV